MAAPNKKIRHNENTRAKIRGAMLINRLEDFVRGKIKMEGPQVTAALGLLRKVLPDLSATALSGDLTVREAKELSDADLADIAVRGRNGTAAPKGRPEGPDTVH